jgi:hypothetical protein
MDGLGQRIAEVSTAFRRGGFLVGEQVLRIEFFDEMPIEIKAAFDMAIERADFIRAADVIQHEWRLPKC